jgi:hypothetical protein
MYYVAWEGTCKYKVQYFVPAVDQRECKEMVSCSYYQEASLFKYGAGVEPSPLLLRSFVVLAHHSWMIDGDDCEAISGINEWQEETGVLGKPCPSAALCITDAT